MARGQPRDPERERHRLPPRRAAGTGGRLAADRIRQRGRARLDRVGELLLRLLDHDHRRYSAFFKGAIWNSDGKNLEFKIRPLTETLKFSGPLIVAGLGVGIAFRAGMFNIGGRGQMLMAGAAAGWVGFKLDLPTVIHLPLAIIVGMLAGAAWGGLAGLIKARTGAHEVILTIMLNYVAFYLVSYALTKKNLLQSPGSDNPKSLPMRDTAILPKIAGDSFNLHLGFLLALIAVGVVWWILERSSLGFKMRAVGINPTAARASGTNVGRIYIVVMSISGA